MLNDLEIEPNPNFHTFNENYPGEEKKDEAEVAENEKDPIIQTNEEVNKCSEKVVKKETKLDIKINECLNEFYKLMNQMAEELGLTMSNFNVAHGMHNDNNYSTAYDIGKLCCHAMTKDIFKDVVKVQSRETPSLMIPGHVYKWENTNALLKEGYTGLKTGITPTAGPCLAATT